MAITKLGRRSAGNFAMRASLEWILSAALLMLITTRAGAEDMGTDAKLMPDAPLNEQVLNLPGDPHRPVLLQVTLFTPPGSGPFPLAVMNHGATRISAENRGERYRYTYSAYYFLSRGYAVALPMARGFAGSGGDLAVAGCRIDAVGTANAEDLRAVISELGPLPDIDPGRIIVAGQSFGGWTTMALGTMDVPGVRGLIGFSPALRESNCPAQDQAMVAGARSFGAAARLPSLWFYGDNDTIMPVATWRAVFDAYVNAGGPAKLVTVGRFMDDSHNMLGFPESLPIWTPQVDAFLAGLGLPATEIHPEYLPMPVPPPSRFADIDNAAAVPFVNDKGRDAYRQFLTRRFPRVFALASNGMTSVTNGGFDPLARALLACRNAGVTCQPYAVDADVVWSGEVATPVEYARVVTAGSTTNLNFAYAINPDCSSRVLPQLSISQAPIHGAASLVFHDGHPRFPAGHPYAACNEAIVPGVSVAYTPEPGFTGSDAVTFEETNPNGSHRVFHMTLTVQ
jgi:dienelactone hydrolase